MTVRKTARKISAASLRKQFLNSLGKAMLANGKASRMIQYRVTSTFGNYRKGVEIGALLVMEDDDGTGMVFHPAMDDFRACVEFCVKGSDGVWTSVPRLEDCYLSL